MEFQTDELRERKKGGNKKFEPFPFLTISTFGLLREERKTRPRPLLRACVCVCGRFKIFASEKKKKKREIFFFLFFFSFPTGLEAAT